MFFGHTEIFHSLWKEPALVHTVMALYLLHFHRKKTMNKLFKDDECRREGCVNECRIVLKEEVVEVNEAEF